MGQGGAALAFLFSVVLMTCFLSMTSPPANAQVAGLFVGKPLLVTIGDWQFLNVTVQDYYPGRTGMVGFAVWKEIPSGQTVAAETCGVSLTGGEMGNCYSPIYGISPGTYFVGVFAISIPYNLPISLVLTLNVSV